MSFLTKRRLITNERPSVSHRNNNNVLVDDVLNEIFTYLCYTYDPPANMTLILSHVSSQWRKVVLSNPRLWTIIQVSAAAVLETYPSSRRSKKQLCLPFIKTIEHVDRFLTCSQQMPLEFSINLASRLPIGGGEILEVSRVQCAFRQCIRDLSAKLSGHLSRIQVLRVSAGEHVYLTDLQVHLFPTSMPLLRDLRMDVADTDMMDVSGSDLISIPPCDGALSVTKVERDCGQLSHLYLNRVAVSFNQFSPRNLRELSLLSLPKDFLPTWTQFRDVLLANESTLEVLEIDFVPSSKNDWQSFTLRKLTCLIFTFTQVKHLYRLVNTLRVPNLDYLSIMDGPRSIAFPVTYDTPRQGTLLSCLLALIEHFPLSRIRHLTLSHLWFSPEDETVSVIANAKNLVINRFVFNFFSALTSLEILTLASPTTVPLDILNYVPVDDSSPPTPMPCLRELELTLFNKHVVRDFLDTFGSAECREVHTIHLTMPLEWQDDMYLDVRYLCREPDIEFVYLKRLFPMLESPPSYWLCQYPARRLFDLDLF